MRRIMPLVVLPLLFAAVAAVAGTGRAGVALANASATISQTSNTNWKLEKTGALDAASSTVTWTITATQQATVSGRLYVTGFVAVTNSGALGAPIGNIVVNLQTKSGSGWETQSSDIADATHGDGATTAQIDPQASSEGEDSFSENGASGTLEFMDAKSNTAFSLVPQVTIAPGATVNLLFAAEFDNTVLKLDTGTPVRAEVIVSFGNAGPGPSSASNVDINGNGTIDADEAWVHSVPARLGLTVPAETAANDSITLTDTASDIATTGTATVSNPTFDLGPTSGTVTAQYSGGTDGGEITNCAHLKGTGSTVTVGSYSFPDVPGADLQACNTQTVGASVITAGWKDGDFTTYIQDEWGGAVSASDAPTVLEANYGAVYASADGLLEVGIPGTSGYSMVFTDATAVIDFLPGTGTSAPLTSDLVNPTSAAAGLFGGDTVALKLNVDFSDALPSMRASNIPLGDLTLCSVATEPALDGMTVRQLLGAAQTLLGGRSSSFTIDGIEPVIADVNASFADGSPSTFAQQHLFNGACPVWKNGDFTTDVQYEWGDGTAAAGQLLLLKFATVYPGGVVLGLPTGGYTMTFADSLALLEYLPTTGPSVALNADVVDPSDAAGLFGGDVVALQLDVDFSDAGLLAGTAGTHFGDLTLCNFTTLPNLNGLTVRQFLADLNALLGGGVSIYLISQLDPVANATAGAFADGSPSTFAQQHLVNGACPAGP